MSNNSGAKREVVTRECVVEEYEVGSELHITVYGEGDWWEGDKQIPPMPQFVSQQSEQDEGTVHVWIQHLPGTDDHYAGCDDPDHGDNEHQWVRRGNNLEYVFKLETCYPESKCGGTWNFGLGPSFPGKGTATITITKSGGPDVPCGGKPGGDE